MVGHRKFHLPVSCARVGENKAPPQPCQSEQSVWASSLPGPSSRLAERAPAMTRDTFKEAEQTARSREGK